MMITMGGDLSRQCLEVISKADSPCSCVRASCTVRLFRLWLVGWLVGWLVRVVSNPTRIVLLPIHPLVVVNVLRGRAEACKAGGLCGRDF